MTFDFQHHLKSKLTFTSASIEPGLRPSGSKSAVARPKKELICPILQQTQNSWALICNFCASRLLFPLFLVKRSLSCWNHHTTCSPVSSLLDHWTQLSHQLGCLTPRGSTELPPSTKKYHARCGLEDHLTAKRGYNTLWYMASKCYFDQFILIVDLL